MTLVSQIERPFSWPVGITGTELGVANASTMSLSDVAATPLTVVTATIHCSAIALPQNLVVNNLGTLVVGAGVAVTGFWLALLDAGLKVRAVTGNLTTLVAGYQTQALTGPASGGFTTGYAGLYYIALGNTFTTTAPTVGAGPTMPSVAAASGPPVLCGTSSTAASATPPAIGTVLGALTGVASNRFYGYVA